jgi:hypothetical protein
MKEGELKAIQPRSFVPRTTDSRHKLGYAENLLLKMELPPRKPNEVVVGDITYLPLQDGSFCYEGFMDGPFFAACGWLGSDGNDDR